MSFNISHRLNLPKEDFVIRKKVKYKIFLAEGLEVWPNKVQTIKNKIMIMVLTLGLVNK
ncbi:hypothetical protein JOC73_002026 [Alkaliphilus hydrothermalis]|uniref:Uncharacterized protein n=1 Tax=Alkaliphilus hydrothermalis TaxID=1482730 RepID=A0ABS2NRK3_9FIRM|nr:hypothetical protein [Alkaliphilus hydrothermalis]